MRRTGVDEAGAARWNISDHPRSHVAAWRLLLLFVALSLATRWLSLVVDVLDLDESAHVVGSWEMMRGRLLYAEFVNNKPPLLYLYYAFAQVLFGRGLFAVHLLTALVTVPLTACAISAFFHHRREGLVGGVIFLVYGAAFIAHDMLAANTEILMILPATWALVLLRDEQEALMAWRAGAAGLPRMPTPGITVNAASRRSRAPGYNRRMPHSLTSRERSRLKARAHALEPTVTIG